MTDQPKRDANGKFAPGGGGGPGRKPRQAEERLVRRLSARLNNGDFDKILDALVRQAQRGDVAATRLLLEYAVGKPKQPISGDGDGEIVFRVIYDKGV